MANIDRTTEFQGCIRVFARNGDTALPPDAAPSNEPSYFVKTASQVELALGCASKLIDQLKKLVSRKGISNDPSMEISDVSRLFKGDMDALKVELTQLEAYVDGTSGRGGPSPGSQRQKHCLCIVASLRQTAAQHTQAFQAALQQRNVVMKEQNERRKLYSHTQPVNLRSQMASPLFTNFKAPVRSIHQGAPQTLDVQRNGSIQSNNKSSLYPPPRNPIPMSTDYRAGSTDYRAGEGIPPHPPPRGPANMSSTGAHIGGDSLGDSTFNNGPKSAGNTAPLGLRRRGGAMEGPGVSGNAAWQVQELQRNSTNRLDEARKAESLISELGSMFSKFSTLVAQQDELVMHIEDDVEMAHGLTSEGQQNLSNYYRIMSGNRGMIIKILLLLAFFVWFFTILY